MSFRRPIGISQAVLNYRVGETDLDREYKEIGELMGTLDRVIGEERGERHPESFAGSSIFNPESTSFNWDTAQDGSSSNAVNYILHSGVDYKIPVLCGGNGIFLAYGVRLTFWMRFMDKQSGVNTPIYLLMPQAPVQYGSGPTVYWTTKFTCFPRQPELRDHATSGQTSTSAPVINYAWNVKDDRGWEYSDGLQPSAAMMNRAYTDPTFNGNLDGDYHRFDAPIVMKQKRVMTLMFRPLMDILQFDSSLSGLNAAVNLPFDDREGGLRNQSVTAQVEFVGERVGGRG